MNLLVVRSRIEEEEVQEEPYIDLNIRVLTDELHI